LKKIPKINISNISDNKLLLRTNYATTIIDNNIIIHGGINISDKGLFEDVLIINPNTYEIKQLISLDNFKLPSNNNFESSGFGYSNNNYSKFFSIPPMSDHQISVINGADLIIFGKFYK
jgi:hypothetical protein